MRKEHALIPLLSPEDKPDKKIKEPTRMKSNRKRTIQIKEVPKGENVTS